MWIDTTLHNYLNQPDRNHVLVEIIDVSAEMAAQEALQEHEELLRRLTDAMPVGLLQLDTERRVVYHNARLLEILHGASDPAARRCSRQTHPALKSRTPGGLGRDAAATPSARRAGRRSRPRSRRCSTRARTTTSRSTW